MADNAGNLGVHQFLRHCGSLFRIGCIIFRDQYEFGFLAIQRNALGIQFFDRHLGAVFIILADVADRTSDRADVGDLHHLLLGECRTGERQGDGGRQWNQFTVAH